jgi:hypothetical protein
MEAPQLAKSIYILRNANGASEIIFEDALTQADPREPVGVLLLKPSSGHLPLQTISEILERLVLRHRYRIRAAVWWNGEDLKVQGLLALHYPGFHRIAHGGLPCLSDTARERLQGAYGLGNEDDPLHKAHGVSFSPELVRTPFDLASEGISPERLNVLWELDRNKEGIPAKAIQRLDEDSFCLALALPDEKEIPPSRRGAVVLLLNGFYAKLEKDFHARGCVAISIQRDSASLTSWEDLRSQYAGKTNPFQAPPGTIRGDAARGLLPVETVSILANVIHLSADEREGQRETRVWWNPELFSRVFGK